MQEFTHLKAWNRENSRNDIDLDSSSVHLGQKIDGKMKSNLFTNFDNNWIRIDSNVQVVEMGFGDFIITDLNLDGGSQGKAAKSGKERLHDASFKKWGQVANNECVDVTTTCVECR